MKFNLDTGYGRHEVEIGDALVVEATAAYKANDKDVGHKHPLAFLDKKHANDMKAGVPTFRQQLYAMCGLNDKNLRLGDAMDLNRLSGMSGVSAASVEDGMITGRLVALPYLFDAIENKLRDNDYGIQGIFNRKAAQVDSIAATKFERPILNYARPEAGRSKAIAQLAEPASMMLLTASDVSYKIPGTSIGLEYSDEAAKAIALPIVTMSVTRQAETEALERTEGYIRSFLLGDTDFGMAALPTQDASDFDPSITGTGELTQLAWVKYLFQNSRRMRIDTIVTDIDGALAIENRKGRPNVMGDNATSKRIDTLESVLNPSWPDRVDVIISQDPNWPANTIMGFDSRYAYHVVNSTVLNYEALQRDAIRRGNKMRFDSGSVAYRLHEDAWSVLKLQ